MLAALIVAFASSAGAAAPVPGSVNGDPTRDPPGFKSHQLAFALPRDGVARPELRSERFYAVILKTAVRCSIPESERLQVQRLFPANKVFSTRFECEGELEETVTYSNVDAKWGFLAAYAGATEREAKEFLAKVAATGRFPGANVRRMQVIRVSP